MRLLKKIMVHALYFWRVEEFSSTEIITDSLLNLLFQLVTAPKTCCIINLVFLFHHLNRYICINVYQFSYQRSAAEKHNIFGPTWDLPGVHQTVTYTSFCPLVAIFDFVIPCGDIVVMLWILAGNME